jgi:DNA helicase HerA-like ATPase
MSLSEAVVARTCHPSSTSYTDAIVARDEEEFLFRLVVYQSGQVLFLGIVEDVYYYSERTLVGSFGLPTYGMYATYPGGGGMGVQRKLEKHLKIRNLLSIGATGRAAPVGNAPDLESDVSLASDSDLERFFPREEFPKKGYLGHVRGTNYPLPLNLDDLCFGNTAILAGIKHGKSRLAALITSQLQLMGKKVLVIDPTGEWKSELMDWIKTLFPSISISHHTMLAYPAEGTAEENQLSSLLESVLERGKGGLLAIVDVSFAEEVDKLSSAKEAVEKRCAIVYDIQRALMRRTQKEYDKPTRRLDVCIVVEEAHEFVPSRPLTGIEGNQESLSTLFAISTKEFRKYGLGHIFIDQSLGSISDEMQIRTYFLGAIGGPRDFEILEARLGTHIASAAQRTIGGTENPSWITYGAATPMPTIPWEIVLAKPENLPLLAKQPL